MLRVHYVYTNSSIDGCDPPLLLVHGLIRGFSEARMTLSILTSEEGEDTPAFGLVVPPLTVPHRGPLSYPACGLGP